MSIATRDSMTTEIQDLRDDPQALDPITRAEIDVQIATARRYPRSPERFIKEAMTMVSVSPEIASQCRYKLPARKGGDNKPIEGPSVRLAEIAAACWGNLRVIGRITGDDGRMVTAQGVAFDLERNLAYAVEIQRGVVTRDGRRYSDDMVRTTCLAAIAIATRNATFKVIPRAFVSVIEEQAQAIARGDEKTLPTRLSAAFSWFEKRGAKYRDICETLGVNGWNDLTLDHLETLQGYRTAINDGDATVESIFAPPAQSVEVTRNAGESKTAALTRGLKERKQPQQDTPPASDDDEIREDDSIATNDAGR